jgi:hypothetical protein
VLVTGGALRGEDYLKVGGCWGCWGLDPLWQAHALVAMRAGDVQARIDRGTSSRGMSQDDDALGAITADELAAAWTGQHAMYARCHVVRLSSHIRRVAPTWRSW